MSVLSFSMHRSVALLIETSNGYCRGLLEGVIAYTKAHGNWSVHLTEQERGALPPAWIRSWRGDGIIARIETDAIGRELKKSGLPIVDLSAARHVSGVPWADTEDHDIARLAVEHFRERSFTNLGYCGVDGFVWSRRRANHFRQIATQSGCRVFEHVAGERYAKKFNPALEKRRIAKWLRSVPRPIGIMGCYDFQAQQILDVCREHRIAVPEQVAVLGVDNDRLICELSEPTLSSVVPDTKRTGYQAAVLLERMMSGEHPPSDVPFLTQPLGIHLRESTNTLAVDDVEVAQALGYIRRNATANIRVGDVVRQSELSRRSLEHRFRKLLGITPSEEIRRVRVDRMKELLRDTDLSIGEIADRTGFEYGEYMAAAFKRETGSTPTEYRRRHS
ncbi:MAG: DNA-binding transcriptional regulator [Planctomycetota bacterium]